MARGARLGQHFLKNIHYAQVLTDAAHIASGDTVLEIGPGEGALTRELLKTGARVVAIEKDELLVQKLSQTFSTELDNGSLAVIDADIRDVEPKKVGLKSGKYIIAANIPYYITGEIIRQFLSAREQPRTIALLIQKEVARRITGEKESILSLSVKVYGTPKIVAIVSRGNFSPPPSVDSAIITISDISRAKLGGLSDEDFFSVVRAGFSSKRKLLSGNLATKFGKEKSAAALAAAHIATKARAEDVPLAEWLRLAQSLFA